MFTETVQKSNQYNLRRDIKKNYEAFNKFRKHNERSTPTKHRRQFQKIRKQLDLPDTTEQLPLFDSKKLPSLQKEFSHQFQSSTFTSQNEFKNDHQIPMDGLVVDVAIECAWRCPEEVDLFQYLLDDQRFWDLSCEWDR